jgi:HK97 family phage major capsid protein
MTTPHPRDDLYRAMSGGVTSEDGKTLTIRLAPHDQWAEIQSATEGHFMERFSRSAYKKAMAENPPKILFQHGKDPQIGEKPIATTDEFGEDATSPYARGQILDGVPELVVDGLRKGVYGSSHRFSVVRETWNEKPVGGAHNPKRLPERTITEAKLPELGPVTWPAYAQASASLRSMTDEMRGITPEPDAPSPDAAETHLGERRDDPVPIAAPKPKEPSVEYLTRDDKASRVRELESSIGARAIEYPGAFPEDVETTDRAENAERDTLVRDIEAWDTRQARLREFAQRSGNVVPGAAPAIIRTQSVEDIYDVGTVRRQLGYGEEATTRLRENALRSIDAAAKSARWAELDGLVDLIEHRDEGDQGKGEAADRVLLTGSPVYKRAFNKYLAGMKDLWTPEEARAAALAVTGTTTTGGYAVPYIFDPTMIHIGAWTSINPYRAACRVETISGGNNWLAVTVGAITAKWDTEGAASVEGGPTFGQPTFTVQRADAFATVSIEALQDRPDLTGELSRLFGEAKDTLEENSFTLGTGATVYPFGMFRDAAFTNVDTATDNVTAIADMGKLEGALPLRHRLNAAFFMSRSTQRQLEALDTTGYYFKRPGQYFAMGSEIPKSMSTGNTGSQLLGYPIWEVPSAVSTLTADGAIIVVFGDPRNYVIVDRIGMNVEVVQTMLNGATPSFPTGQRGIYCYWRGTARPINVDGMRSLSVQ